jgi:hypothetical protein
MAHPIVFRDEVEALLSAIMLTAAATGGNSPHDAAYRRGFAAAIGAVATGLQIPPGAICERLAGFDGRGRLNDAGKSYTREV